MSNTDTPATPNMRTLAQKADADANKLMWSARSYANYTRRVAAVNARYAMAADLAEAAAEMAQKVALLLDTSEGDYHDY